MNWSFKNYLLILCFLPLLLSCHNEVEEQKSLEISLCLPIQGASPKIRRVMGDPGTNEVFDLPRYIYLFVMKQSGDTWSVWRREELKLDAENWIATRYAGLWMTRGDSIYKYKEPIRFVLGNEAPEGRVYAICSNKKLTFNTAFNSVSNLTQLLDWKFDSSPDSIQENLKNIYSTPYNYKNAGGSYYCSFDCTSGHSFNIDLVLYHVASKVDIKWSVEENKRIDKVTPANGVRLTYMEARRLFNGQAYCFKPMKNEVATLPTSGYDIENIVTPSDEGLWWEGRSYFYTIPYYVAGEPNYFPLQMVLCTNGVDKANGYKLTMKQPMDTADVFVPWLRGNFNLTQPLANTSEVKIYDE